MGLVFCAAIVYDIGRKPMKGAFVMAEKQRLTQMAKAGG